MARREVFGFDLGSAAGAIDLDDSDPLRIGREIEIASDQWRMNFRGIAVVEQAASLIVLARRANDMPAAIAQPNLVLEVQIEVFSDANSALMI